MPARAPSLLSWGIQKNKRMLDTIRVKTSLPVRSDREQELSQNESTSWINRSERVFHSHFKKWVEEINAHNRISGFNATVKDGTVTRARASFPRLLYGSNGHQIKMPSELERASWAFLNHLSFLTKQARPEDLRITGMDIAINLQLDPREVLPLHRNVKHPMIDRETEEYYNTPPEDRWGRPPHVLNTLNTVRFHGSRTTIQIYDKVREVLGKKSGTWPEQSQCTRVEIQLSGAKHIAKQLGFEGRDYLSVNDLNLPSCYLCLRRILMGFDDNGATPDFEPNLVSFLAILEQHPETWKTIGLRPIDWWKHSNNPKPKRFREVRKQVGKLQLKLEQFRWADHLPGDRLPDIVDIDEDGREIPISSPWNFRCFPGRAPGPPAS